MFAGQDSQDTHFVPEFHQGSVNSGGFFRFVDTKLKIEVAEALDNLSFGSSVATKQ